MSISCDWYRGPPAGGHREEFDILEGILVQPLLAVFLCSPLFREKGVLLVRRCDVKGVKHLDGTAGYITQASARSVSFVWLSWVEAS